MEFRFERERSNKFPREKMIQELQRVAKIYNYRRFSIKEFDKVSVTCKSGVIEKAFDGSWNKALDSIGIPLKTTTKRHYSEIELFNEMERVWKIVGHRPSELEWNRSEPKINYNLYRRYFDGWINACSKFIEFKMGNSVQVENEESIEQKHNEDCPTEPNSNQKNDDVVKKEKRDVPLRLRLLVLQKYDFKCSFCGRSPAIDKGVILHIDHILPIAKGGKTELENLRTLCKECNLGKSDMIV
jgi:molybdenum cofactor biosynthesis enzyme MoaA